MEILKFIFILGINFSIFGFIWNLIMIGVRLLSSTTQPRNQALDYVLRIVKYFLLVSVTANFIITMQGAETAENLQTVNIVIGTIVLGIYLLGKLQNRAVLHQLGKHPLFARFAGSVDPKVERYLLLGSLIYFVFCLLYPWMVDNALVGWFTESIITIYETPVINWIFMIIAFFFLINILMRAANVVMRLLSGQSLTNPNIHAEFKAGRSPFEDEDKRDINGGFSDYEDVTDEEEKKP